MIPLAAVQLPPDVDPTIRYTGGGLPKGWIMIVISIALYVLPTLLAWKRGSRRFRIIAMVNIALGWTLIGWIAALVMTFSWEPPPIGETDVPHVPR